MSDPNSASLIAFSRIPPPRWCSVCGPETMNVPDTPLKERAQEGPKKARTRSHSAGPDTIRVNESLSSFVLIKSCLAGDRLQLRGRAKPRIRALCSAPLGVDRGDNQV